MGDTVHIRTTPTISINTYNVGQELTYETPEPNVVDLLIDKGRSWSWKDDDVQRVQANYDYQDDWTEDAGRQLQINIDSNILANFYSDAHASNKGTTAGAISSAYDLGTSGSAVSVDKTNVVDYIADMGTVLDEQNVPNENRYLVAPAWFCNLIKKSDLKDASLSGDAVSIARNGRVGMIDRFTLYMSNQVATSSDGGNTVYNMVAGHISGLTFASQLVKNEGPMKHPGFFGDFFRGLQVFGYKTIKPEAVVHFYALKG